jgi:hypothetical protein
MKMKWFMVMMVAAAFVIAALAACDSATEYLEASDQTPCGRYCIKCGTCKDVGEGYIKMAMDYTCAFEEGGKVCELACDEGSDYIPGANIKENVTNIEESTGQKVTELTCETFALAVAGGAEDGPCLRFCSKCVECSPVSSGSEWCAKEGGIPCITACQEGFESYVTDLESFAADNTEGIETLSDIDCNDWEGTLEASGLEQPEIPSL